MEDDRDSTGAEPRSETFELGTNGFQGTGSVWKKHPSHLRKYRSGFTTTTTTTTTAAGQVWPYGSPQQLDFQTKLSELHMEVLKLQGALAEKSNEEASWKKAHTELEERIGRLEELSKLNFILERIEEEARDLLIDSQQLKDLFLKAKNCNSFVMSIDMRRSTDLMLNAQTPELYAKFLNTVCDKLRDVILLYHGVFDKFTGDGILAFFPDFFTGPDAGYYALKAAQAAHRVFAETYESHEYCFSPVLLEVGLGIGIDYGDCHLIRMGDGLTVVGGPVVFACRMGNAPAGKTFLNQPAYEQISAKYEDYFVIEKTEVKIKHAGRSRAYSVESGRKELKCKPPAWHDLIPQATSSGEAEKDT